jgi:hypothetical protein
MALLMQQLGLPIPAFVRTDRVLLSHKATAHTHQAGSSDSSLQPEHTEQQQGQPNAQEEQQQQPQQQQNGAGSGIDHWSFSFTVASVHGEECPLPMIASAQVLFSDHAAFATRAAQQATAAANSNSLPLLGQPLGTTTPAAAAGGVDSAAAAAAPAQPPPVDVQGLQQVLPAEQLSGQVPWRVQRVVPGALQGVAVVLQLQLVDAADEDKRQQQVRTYCLGTRMLCVDSAGVVLVLAVCTHEALQRHQPQ